MTFKEKIIKLFNNSNELSVKEIVEHLNVSKQMVHLIVNKLVEEHKVEKLGKAPKTIYRLIKTPLLKENREEYLNISKQEKEFIQQNFLVVSDTGSLLEGMDGFSYWCTQRKLPLEKTFKEFIETKKKYNVYYDKNGNIDGTEKLKNTKGYDKIYLDTLFYLDFYAIERFGKTRLGTLLHYAKQGQNKFLMQMMMQEIAQRIKDFVTLQKADAIGFVPPTIRREVQIMKFIQNHLKLSLPVVEIKKISGIIPVPQKSLSKLDERIRNAENTFAITEQRKFKHLILIDDAVGSGSTLNQIAGKIKHKDVASKITGLAIVGSFKGFDVITDI